MQFLVMGIDFLTPLLVVVHTPLVLHGPVGAKFWIFAHRPVQCRVLFKFKYGKTPPGFLLKVMLVPIWSAPPVHISNAVYQGRAKGWNDGLAVQYM